MGLHFGASSLQHFINDLDAGHKYTLSKFTDETKLERVVSSLEGRKA